MAIQVTSRPTPQVGEFSVSETSAARVEVIMARYPEDRRASGIIPLLDIAQRENGGWLSKEAIEWVALTTESAPIRVYEVASFYSMFYTEEVGEHVVQVCRTTPCWLRGSDALTHAAEEHLGIGLGQTTDDKKFTLIEVECLGACVNAPMVQINDNYYEDLGADAFKGILDDLAAGKVIDYGNMTGRIGSAPEGGPQALKDFDPSINAGKKLPDYSVPAES
ncbi:NADH-quinone oxidoreductase subunit NuoE [Alphaproteobacteria bacterium]|nr:NADH-quinone oxidoreductase subunit NuoE [Alphaproteobacteria bacterium]